MAGKKRDTELAKRVGGNIRRIRESRKIGQAELGRLAEIQGNNSIWRYEDARALPGLGEAKRIADVLQCPIEAFFDVQVQLEDAPDEHRAIIRAALPEKNVSSEKVAVALKVLQVADSRAKTGRSDRSPDATETERWADREMERVGGRPAKSLSERPPAIQSDRARKKKRSRGGA